MAIHGTTGFCSACGKDAVFSRDFGSDDKTPLLCPNGHDHREFGGSRSQKRTSGVISGHDPYEYPAKEGAWYRGRLGITTSEARKIQRQNKVLSENTKRSASGGRHLARIPAALFYGQKKHNGLDYWRDRKNVERVAKDWGVNNK